MCQRILELLAQHPEGLSAAAIRVHLAIERPIGDTMQNLRRSGAVQAQGEGRKLRYAIAE